MRKLFFLFFTLGCSLSLPAKVGNKGPINIEKNGTILTLYIESEDMESEAQRYSVVGIHPLFGREFLIQVESGKVTKEEYGYLFTPSEVREILEQVLIKE